MGAELRYRLVHDAPELHLFLFFFFFFPSPHLLHVFPFLPYLFSVFMEAVSAKKVTHSTSKINTADIAVESGLCIQAVPCEHHPDVSWHAAHLADYLPC